MERWIYRETRFLATSEHELSICGRDFFGCNFLSKVGPFAVGSY